MKSGLLCSTIGALLLAVAPSQAQQATKTYPTKQVRLVVPYPAGGPTDLIARLLSQKLGERLGQTFYVDNVSGASGALGAGQVAQAAPDGHTLLVVTNDFAVASVTNKNLPYDPIKNFSPVTIVASSPQVVAVNPSVPAKTMKELVAVIREAPEKYNYAALGIGFGQLSAERLFKLGLQLDRFARIPFNGAAPAVNSTIAGHTQVIFLGLPPVAPHLSSDKLRAIAVTSSERTKAFPQIPTLRESGVPDQESELNHRRRRPGRNTCERPVPPAEADRRDRRTARREVDARYHQFSGRREYAGRVRRPDQERHCDLGQGDEGREHFAQLACCVGQRAWRTT